MQKHENVIRPHFQGFTDRQLSRVQKPIIPMIDTNIGFTDRQLSRVQKPCSSVISSCECFTDRQLSRVQKH